MSINQKQQDNLSKALGLFIEGFRPYIVSILSKEAGDKWPSLFVEALYPVHRESWNMGLKNGSQPEVLIDYAFLKSFALRYKELLKNDFGKDLNKLATRLETITDVRNKIAHYSPVTPDEFTEAFINFKSISRSLKMAELETAFENLQSQTSNEEPTPKPSPDKNKDSNTTNLSPWFKTVKPHVDIQMGRLDESIFAANLGEVALGFGREIYNNPVAMEPLMPVAETCLQ